MMIIKAIIVGGLTVVIGVIVSQLLQNFTRYQTPKECEHWNDNHIMEIALFITGFVAHLITIGLSKFT